MTPVITSISTSVADVVNETLSSTADPESVTALPTVTLTTTVDATPLRTDPFISDPVSGGGNASLWETPGSDEDDRRERDGKPAPTGGNPK